MTRSTDARFQAASDQVSGLLASGRYRLDPAQLPRTPWVVVVKGPDSAVVATCSPLHESGLFWAAGGGAEGQGIVIGRNPFEVIHKCRTPPSLDEGYLREFAVFSAPPDRTPYKGVHWLPPGVTAVWQRGATEPEVIPWSGPDAWPAEPTLEGPAAREHYLAEFDRTLAELLPDDRPIAAQLSGGLDSSFVVAGLARLTTADNPVHAFSHAPHPAADLRPIRGWDPDDSHVARAMERAYPGRVVVHRVVNDELTLALDAAREVSERSWMPSTNQANWVWTTKIARLAAAVAAPCVFTGANGNPTFSHEPTYAFSHYLRRGDLAGIVALLPKQVARGIDRRSAVKARFLNPMLGRTPLLSVRQESAERLLGLEPTPRPLERGFTRTEYLAWMARSHSSMPAVLCPAGFGVPLVDPFTAPRLMEIAAALTPREWAAGPYPRGFARRLGAGRVPDEIRLRTRSGGQGMDAWFAARLHRDRYLDEVSQLSHTPILESWLDVERLHRMVAAWPWGEVRGPDDFEFNCIDHVLSLAEFVRMTQKRLKALRDRPGDR